MVSQHTGAINRNIVFFRQFQEFSVCLVKSPNIRSGIDYRFALQ